MPTGTAVEQPKRRSGFSGAVDWRLAAKTGATLVPAGPRTYRYTAEQVVAELAAASVRAESPVREVSRLLDDQPVPAARIVDRPGWIAAAADSMAQLTGSDGTSAERGLLQGKPAGVQAGAMLAFLSTAILGQYDPFTGPDGTLLLVAPNIMAVERGGGGRGHPPPHPRRRAGPAVRLRLWGLRGRGAGGPPAGGGGGGGPAPRRRAPPPPTGCG
ncbi:zinc-dependent metalloprotease, partial [Nocardia brasiliensis]|uniref:zinc-dependent metalloprotease n=1 Tax=Nocardia brasiliensis TaxID=37326 RepID=UPI00245796FE